jgi:hypothetical protein
MLNINSGIKQSKTSISTTVPHFIKLPTIEEIFGLKKPVPIIECNSQIEKCSGEMRLSDSQES